MKAERVAQEALERYVEKFKAPLHYTVQYHEGKILAPYRDCPGKLYLAKVDVEFFCNTYEKEIVASLVKSRARLSHFKSQHSFPNGDIKIAIARVFDRHIDTMTKLMLEELKRQQINESGKA